MKTKERKPIRVSEGSFNQPTMFTRQLGLCEAGVGSKGRIDIKNINIARKGEKKELQALFCDCKVKIGGMLNKVYGFIPHNNIVLVDFTTDKPRHVDIMNATFEITPEAIFIYHDKFTYVRDVRTFEKIPQGDLTDSQAFAEQVTMFVLGHEVTTEVKVTKKTKEGVLV